MKVSSKQSYLYVYVCVILAETPLYRRFSKFADRNTDQDELSVWKNPVAANSAPDVRLCGSESGDGGD